MDPQLLAWLRATYGKGAQRQFDPSIGTFRYGRPASLDEDAWRRLNATRYAPNTFERITHDEAVDRILDADRSISWDDVLDGFVLAAAGRWPRGSQTPISSAYAANLEPHDFENPEASKNPEYVCYTCGLKQRQLIDRTYELYAFHRGSAWNELPGRYVFDLEEWPQLSPPAVADEDAARFRQMLDAIDGAPPAETPGALAKRLGKAGFPGGRGLLQALAELGIMRSTICDPSFDRLVPRPEIWATKIPGSARSDITLPLAAWRGADGIDWERVRLLFPRMCA